MYVDDTFVSTGSGEHQADKPAILFIHGAGMDHTVWTPQARYFSRHQYNVINPDLPGHGRTGGQLITSIHSIAEWLATLLDKLKIEKTHIVGHSMGSLIAIDFAASFPKLTDKLALLGTTVPMPVADQLLDAARENRHEAIEMANTWSHRNALGGAENPGIWNLSMGERLLERADKDVFFTDLNACNEFANGLELARQIKAPTLMVLAENDMMTAPVRARDVVGAIEGARVHMIPNCGHSMMNEKPNDVLDALIGHFETE